MIGLDTNLLVRVLTEDDPQQAAQVRSLFRSAEERRRPLFLNVVVLSELAWTLRGRPYKRTRDQIADALQTLLEIHVFRIQHREDVQAAVDEYRRGTADFPDYLIGRLNGSAGCRETATYDRKLSESSDFRHMDEME